MGIFYAESYALMFALTLTYNPKTPLLMDGTTRHISFNCGADTQWSFEKPTEEKVAETKRWCAGYDVSVATKTITLTVVDENITKDCLKVSTEPVKGWQIDDKHYYLDLTK